MKWETLLSNRRPGKKAPHHDQSRSAFEQDYDRIIFSHPFRRLQDKTQVHPLADDDFVHTRLTHSLEVSSVGRSLGKIVGNVILERHAAHLKEFSDYDFGAIVGAAALCHDIGNPPFGHSGEEAISEFYLHGDGKRYQQDVSEKEWQDLIRFEGNAQGFRLLNKDRYQGLELTAATLAAFTKYPRPSSLKDPDKTRKSQKKYGFYQSEHKIFHQVADECGLISLENDCRTRHPLAFLVEAADDICYHLIDLEDGCRLGLISFNETLELFAGLLKENFDPEKLARIHSREEKIGILRALSISKLLMECSECFLDNEKVLLEGAYDKAFTEEIPSSFVLKDIISLSISQIYQSRQVLEIEVAGFEVIPGLLKAFAHSVTEAIDNHQTISQKALIKMLPEDVRREVDVAGNDVYRVLLSINDFISGLTDTRAITLYRQIKGISPGGR